jgi:hypothetical protein
VEDATQRAAAELAFNELILEELHRLKREAEPPEWFYLLKRLLPSDILTTNVDSTIENLLLDRLVNVFRFKDGKPPPRHPGFKNLYKIHGDEQDARSLVFTEDQYQRWDKDDPYLSSKLTVMFSEKPTICLGYSFRDPDVQLRHFEAFLRFYQSVEPVYLVFDPAFYPENNWQVLRESRVYFESRNVTLLFGSLEDFVNLALEKATEYQGSVSRFIDEMGAVKGDLIEWAAKVNQTRERESEERLGEPSPERATLLVQSLLLLGEREEARVEVGLATGNDLSDDIGLALLRDIMYLVSKTDQPVDRDVALRMTKTLSKFTTEDYGAWNFGYHPDRFRLFLDVLAFLDREGVLDGPIATELVEPLAEHILFAGSRSGECWASGTILARRVGDIPRAILRPLLEQLIPEQEDWPAKKAAIRTMLQHGDQSRAGRRLEVLAQHPDFDALLGQD